MHGETEHHPHGNRVEDLRLITGAAKYAADWNAAGQLHGHFLRADRAHAEIVSIDVSQALAAPGVKGVFTGEDAIRAGYVKPPHGLTFPGKDDRPARAPDRPVL